MRHDFVTIADLPKEKLMYLLEMAKEFENHPNRELLKGKVVATLFFEPSTRTRLSFETAANRLRRRPRRRNQRHRRRAGQHRKAIIQHKTPAYPSFPIHCE